MPKLLLTSLLLTTLLGKVTGMQPAQATIPHTALFAPAVAQQRLPFFKAPKAPEVKSSNLALQDFVRSVVNGRANNVVGVYMPGVLALPVGQQPKGNAGYVTREENRATQFSLANRYGTVGILAHNDLAGEQFSGIQMNQYAIVIYGDGRMEYYRIAEVQKYQALSPTSTFSDFVNLDGSEEKLSANQLFSRIYGPGDRLVFQTCIEAQGDASWGRMFIIATPADEEVQSMVKQSSFLLDFASFGMAFQ